jgi:hypothetical protein
MMAAEEVRRARTGWWPFLRHYLEMVAAMLAGMLVLGGAVRGVLALAGLEYPTRYPELVALEMAVEMSVGMVAWMRRRHVRSPRRAVPAAVAGRHRRRRPARLGARGDVSADVPRHAPPPRRVWSAAFMTLPCLTAWSAAMLSASG